MTNKAGYVQHFAHFVYSVVHCEPNCGTVASCLSGNIEWPKKTQKTARSCLFFVEGFASYEEK